MSELAQLREAIFEQVRAKGARQLKQAQAEYRETLAKQSQQLLDERANVRARQLSETKQRFERQNQQIQYQLRQTNLAAKQEVLSALFESALQKMTEWDSGALWHFMTPILDHYASQADHFSVAIGEQTQSQLGHATIVALAERYPNMSLTVPIRHESGFVVTVDRIDYNYLFKDLVQSVYQEESYQIDSQIFQA